MDTIALRSGAVALCWYCVVALVVGIVAAAIALLNAMNPLDTGGF